MKNTGSMGGDCSMGERYRLRDKHLRDRPVVDLGSRAQCRCGATIKALWRRRWHCTLCARWTRSYKASGISSADIDRAIEHARPAPGAVSPTAVHNRLLEHEQAKDTDPDGRARALRLRLRDVLHHGSRRQIADAAKQGIEILTTRENSNNGDEPTPTAAKRDAQAAADGQPNDPRGH